MSDDADDQPRAGDAVMHSFRGQTLEGADFSGKDLRGADFTGANLRSASFREAKVGVAPRVGGVILGIAIAIAIGTGMVIGWSVDEIRNETTAEEWDEVATGGSLGLIVLVLLALIFWKGFDVAIKTSVSFYLVVVAINIAANFIWEDFEWLALARATADSLSMRETESGAGSSPPPRASPPCAGGFSDERVRAKM